MTGRELKHYQILEVLGSGGMGEVYKARDTKLDRLVAVKVLRAGHLTVEFRRQRFLQEARAASALNHPNIVTIHDIDRQDGTDFMVMEYLPGRTLDARIPRGGMPLNQVLRIAVQIAEGLRRAHSAGIVHRDLKPSNIMVSDEGQVKILDFGLAKLTVAESDPSEQDTTRTARAETEEGTVLGTVSYMSPEQADGRKLDARTDIFSFGSVLYEMLAGRRAFAGESRLSTMSAILKEEPKPLDNLPADLEKTIRRCLRKDREKRYQHMDDVKIAIEEVREESESGTQPAATALPSGKGAGLWVGIGVAAALAAAVGAGLVATKSTGTGFKPARVTRLTRDSGLTEGATVSPDGKLIAYSSDRAGGGGQRDIWVQQLAGGQPLRLTTSMEDEDSPSFSADGTHVVYASTAEGGAIYSIPTLGGDPRLLSKVPLPTLLQCSPDGKWIAFQSTGWTGAASFVSVIPAAGGAAKRLETGLPWSVLSGGWSPDGTQLLLLAGQKQAELDWRLVPSVGGGAKPVALREALAKQGLALSTAGAGRGGIFGPTQFDRLQWDQEGLIVVTASEEQQAIYRIPFDSATTKIGEPKLVVSSAGGALQLANSRSAPLVYASIDRRQGLYSIPMDTNVGKVTGPLQPLTHDDAINLSASLSNDGSRMAFVSNRTGKPQLWWRDMRTGKDTMIPTEPVFRAGISPDGSRIAYELSPHETAVRWMDLQTGDAKPACERCSFQRWQPDGTRFLYYTREPSFRFVWHDPSSGKDTLLANEPPRGINWFRLSADQQWISFHTIQGGRTSIHVAPYDGSEFGAAGESSWVRVTTEDQGHHFSWWSPDGSLLYFLSGRQPDNAILAQPLDPVSKKPRGKKFVVFRAPSGQTFLNPRVVGMAMTADRIVLAMEDRKGNLWKVEPDGGR